MEKLKIEVKGATGSAYKKGELYSSGVIKYEDGTISHISAEISHGRTVTEYFEPVIVKEEAKPASAVQSAAVKPKKKKA